MKCAYELISVSIFACHYFHFACHYFICWENKYTHSCFVYLQVQTRSADEPMTTFVLCNECGNRWKVRKKFFWLIYLLCISKQTIVQ